MSTRWVLLRGLAREAGHWGDFPRHLREALGPDHEVLALDLPGNGRWHGLRSPGSIAAMASACRANLAGAGQPVRLVALSLGAMVAIEWARMAPQEIEACALVNTSLRGFSPWWQRLRPANYGRLLALLRPGLPVLAREQAVLRMTSTAASAEMMREWAEIATQRPVSARNVLRQLRAAGRYRAPAIRPDVPMLVLCSAGDRLVHPTCSHALARRWALPLREHPWAGHDLPLDDPVWLAGQLSQWVPGRSSD